MTRQLIHLDVDAVLAIHAEVLAAHGGAPGVRDRALLESAVAAPRASIGGQALMTHPVEIAAAYLFYLCRNHPFVDGNKRAALAAALVFLDANGLLADPDLPGRDVDAWEALVMDLAAGRVDRAALTRRFRRLLRPQAVRRARTRKREGKE